MGFEPTNLRDNSFRDCRLYRLAISESSESPRVFDVNKSILVLST